jgi:Zn-dependent protease with chaperone function
MLEDPGRRPYAFQPMAVAGISFLVAALVTAFFNWLALIPWRKAAAGLPWTERAAILFPARSSAASNIWFVIAGVALAARAVSPGSYPVFALVGGLLGALAGTYPIDRAIHPDFPPASWLHIVAGRWIIEALGWVILAGFALTVPHTLNAKAWMLVGAYIVVDAALRLWLRLRLMKWLRLLRAPTERLSGIVHTVSGKMGIWPRATWVMPGPGCNAVAFTVTRELAFTQKLLDTLSDEEISCICAHELGHLTESAWVAAARIVTALWTFVLILAVPIGFEYGPDGLGVLLAVLGLARYLVRKIFRRMERRADNVAAAGGDPSVYARALERIYMANQMPATMPGKRRMIHPDLYDRMTAAGITPGYPRPRAPHARSWTSYVLWAITFLLVLLAHVD